MPEIPDADSVNQLIEPAEETIEMGSVALLT